MQWHNEVETEKEGSNKELLISQLDQKKMEKFVDHSFQNWGWSSNKEFAKDLKKERRKPITHKAWFIITTPIFCNRWKRKQGSSEKSLKTIINWAILQQLGDSSTIRNWIHSHFGVSTNYSKKSNKIEEIEEIMVVSEEWNKLAGFAKGLLKHVISMDSGCGFVHVPEGVKILMNTRKVLRVKYVQPTARWVLDLEAVRAKAQKLVEEEKDSKECWKGLRLKQGNKLIKD